MKITFLGTNGWYDTATGNSTCVLIETKTEYIVCDAGNGFYKLNRYIKSNKPIYLFLSHLHLDHIIGLHTLVKFNFSQGIAVYCPPKAKKHLLKFISKPYTAAISSLPIKVRIAELNKKIHLPIDVEFKRLFHPVTCYGFRFKLEGKIISFCSDTGLCKNLHSLAKESDFLITECALRVGQSSKAWPHLNSKAAASLAKKAKVKRMALIHFNPHLFPCFSDRKKALLQARRIFKNTIAPRDNFSLEL